MEMLRPKAGGGDGVSKRSSGSCPGQITLFYRWCLLFGARAVSERFLSKASLYILFNCFQRCKMAERTRYQGNQRQKNDDSTRAQTGDRAFSPAAQRSLYFLYLLPLLSGMQKGQNELKIKESSLQNE